LREAFVRGGFNVRRLAVEVATRAATPPENKRPKNGAD